MTPKRVRTLATTFGLLILNVVIGELWHFHFISDYPLFPRAMLIIAMGHTMGRCMLTSFGHRKVATALSVTGFIMLCICLFYAVSFLDYAVFALCMGLLLHRVNSDCSEDECALPT